MVSSLSLISYYTMQFAKRDHTSLPITNSPSHHSWKTYAYFCVRCSLLELYSLCVFLCKMLVVGIILPITPMNEKRQHLTLNQFVHRRTIKDPRVWRCFSRNHTKKSTQAILCVYYFEPPHWLTFACSAQSQVFCFTT